MISIIVPVYNVEKYLEACVNSILNSTFTDYELILVDDGSTDRSGEICDDYQEMDQRITVIHQENAGVAAARNAGLRVSRGEYITFVDSDDLVHPLMLETLITEISSGDYDMSMVLHHKGLANEAQEFFNSFFDSNSGKYGTDDREFLTPQEYIRMLFTADDFAGPWHKLFRRSLIFSQKSDFLEFKPIHAEDTEWLIRVILRMKQAVLKPLVMYFYMMREDSLTHAQSERSMNPVMLGRLQTVYSFLDLLTEDMPQSRALCLNDLYKKIKLYSYMARGTSYQEETSLQCKRIYKETIKEYLRSPIPPMEKIKNLMFYHFPGLYRLFINLVESVAKLRH
ncbi:MAG: glycosyltransferase [Muribaculaceae bacterium]|nr:glycosyltransferase [Muribaculaceae bacterium]